MVRGSGLARRRTVLRPVWVVQHPPGETPHHAVSVPLSMAAENVRVLASDISGSPLGMSGVGGCPGRNPGCPPLLGRDTCQSVPGHFVGDDTPLPSFVRPPPLWRVPGRWLPARWRRGEPRGPAGGRQGARLPFGSGNVGRKGKSGVRPGSVLRGIVASRYPSYTLVILGREGGPHE